MNSKEETIADKILYQLKSTDEYSNSVYSNSKVIRDKLLAINEDDAREESEYEAGLLNEILHRVIIIRGNLTSTVGIQIETIHNIETTTKRNL